MADTPGSKKAWSDNEKIAYLVLVLDTEGKVDEKIRVGDTCRDSISITPTHSEQKTPTPAGRTVVSCSRMFTRLKEKHKADMDKIKAGQDLDAAPASGGDDAQATPTKKSQAGRKRKAKADEDAADMTPLTKKTGGRKKNDVSTPIKQEVHEDQEEDLENGVEV